jgi:hypothetical protein
MNEMSRVMSEMIRFAAKMTWFMSEKASVM